MINYHRKFYTDFYRDSGGYMPCAPFSSNFELGDIILILNGKMIKLGNIGDPFFGVYEDISINEEWQSYMDSCSMESGVNQSFMRKNDLENVSVSSKQSILKLVFDSSGDYIFDAFKISTKNIENFYEFQFKLLQQLTSEKFSFKELFVVTSIAKTDAFSLLTAKINDANVEIFLEGDDQPEFTFEDLNREDYKLKISRMKGIVSPFIRKIDRVLFFKAQKLEASPQGKEIINKYILENLPESVQKYKRDILRYTPTQVLPAVNIYPAKVHKLFHFREMNLNDLLDLFGTN